jgi:choline dehydrogenase-like flavoprotein
LRKDPIHASTRVVIIGGGIGGLAAGLALARRGFRVKVLERDPCFLHRRQGYGLTIQQGGLALGCLQLGEAIAAAASWSQSHFVFDSQGQITAFWGPTWWERARQLSGSPSPGEGGLDPPAHASPPEEAAQDGAAAESPAAARGTDSEAWRKLEGHNLHIPRQALRSILLHSLLALQVSSSPAFPSPRPHL